MRTIGVGVKGVVLVFVSLLLLSMTAVHSGIYGCGGSSANGGGTTEEGGETFSSGECEDYCGTEMAGVTVDLSGVEALFTVQSEEGSSATALVALPDGKNSVTINTSSPLFAITGEGIQGIMSALDPWGEDAIDGLPRLSFVAVSPKGEVFLAFDHPWIYRDSYTDSAGEVSIEDYSDPWAPSSPFTCQLFVVDHLIGSTASGVGLAVSNTNQVSGADEGGSSTGESGTGDSGAESEEPTTPETNLVCINNSVELNTWDSRTKQIQFDEDGNAYFAAHVPGNWKDLLYKYTTAQAIDAVLETDTIPEAQISEIINANICFQRFLVTEAGGVLYTGVTSTSGDCNGDNFFRFVTPDGALQQITSGWWDYTFAPIEVALENGTAENDYYVGQILFYGPDPQVATAPEWNDSCLFRFDPNATDPSQRSTQIADCDIDIWRYINFDSDGETNTDAVRRTRCEQEKSMMGGGNQPDKILLVDSLDGDGLNEIYVVGNIYEKSANEWKCDLCTDGAPAAYCRVGDTLHFEATTVADCAALTGSGTWGTGERCFNNQIASATTGNVCDTTLANWRTNSQWCEFSGNDSMETRSALARIDENYDGQGNNRIVRLSGNDEIVGNGWAIDNRLAYVSFNVESGEYELREEGVTNPLLVGIEVYELMQDPRDATKWFFNGLRFSDNSYVLGTFDPDVEDPESTLDVETGLTGQIDTLVIVPEL